MAPCRPLVDLSLIAVFKQLTPDNQLKAAAMSPRCTALVRAANRRVKTLIIAELYENVEKSRRLINHFSLKTKPSMQLAKVRHRGHQGTSPDYPMGGRLSKWSCLQLNLIAKIDSTIIEQIVNAFSALADLKFIMNVEKFLFSLSLNPHTEHIIAILSHSSWAKQLTSLMLLDNQWISDELANRLFTAINGLIALQHLAFNWGNFTFIPESPLPGQLKTVQLLLNSHKDNAKHFFRSLETAVTKNINLEVDLYSYLRNMDHLFSFSELLRSRIVRFSTSGVINSTVPLQFQPFSSLTSLYVFSFETSHVGPLWTAFSQLKQLIHLDITVNFQKHSEIHSERELPLPPRPLAQLSSLQALDLTLIYTSHSQVSWLNLQQTMPHLQAIHLPNFVCELCFRKQKTHIAHNSECLTALLANLHPGVSNEKISFGDTTADKMLLALS